MYILCRTFDGNFNLISSYMHICIKLYRNSFGSYACLLTVTCMAVSNEIMLERIKNFHQVLITCNCKYLKHVSDAHMAAFNQINVTNVLYMMWTTSVPLSKPTKLIASFLRISKFVSHFCCYLIHFGTI